MDIDGVRIKKSRERGASMVELAIAVPFLLLILSGVFEIGYPLYQYQKVLDAARHVGETVAARPLIEPGVSCGTLTSESYLEEILHPYFKQASIRKKAWEITAETTLSIEDDYEARILNLTIEHVEGEGLCLLCYFPLPKIKVESAHKILGDCI